MQNNIENHIQRCLLWQDRASAIFKRTPKDFVVNEILDWAFKGEGEHIFLYVEKTDCNTVWVAKQLAKFYGVPPRDVGYSGLKDRHAVTRQYFSVRLPGVKPDSYELPEHNEYRVVSHVLHDKKLKRGNHQYNDFVITLHDVKGARADIDERLAFIREHGCPNLFDSQRFGNDNNNLSQVFKWVNGDIDVRKRTEKSLLLSALRSAFFNHQLATRVANNTWQTVQSGDIAMLNGTNSYFTVEESDSTITQRGLDKDIHPAGKLIGENDDLRIMNDNLDALNVERLRELLRRERMDTGYRAMRLIVRDLQWIFIDDATCEIKMRLPTGAYASGVVKQVFNV